MSLCNFTPPTALGDVADTQESIGQIVRLFVQRNKSGATENSMTVATSDPTLAATWSALFAETDSTKVVKTPVFDEFTASAGDPILYGGDTMASGVQIVLGTNPSTWEGQFLNKSQNLTIKPLQDLIGEVYTTESLQVFGINDCGNIVGFSNDDYTTFKGLPASMFYVGTPGAHDRVNPGKNMLRVMIKAEYFKYLKIVTPADFDALSI